MDLFALSHHDLLVRAGWCALSTSERWGFIKAFRGSLRSLAMVPLPVELEDQFWGSVLAIVMFMMDDTLMSYFMDPELGFDRRVHLLEGTADPDEWMLAVDDPTAWCERSAWDDVGDVDWVIEPPPTGDTDPD